MSPKESQTDVLIVGAGPVGLSLAIMLAQMGINFRIIGNIVLSSVLTKIEKRTESTPYSRAFAIQSRTLEVFRQLGVLEATSTKGRIGNLGFQTFYRGKPLFDVNLPPSSSSCPYLVGLEQSETELILSTRLSEFGVEVEKGTALESFVFSEGRGEAESALVSNLETQEKQIISFKYVVGCDGGHSVSRKLAGIPFSGEKVNIGLALCDATVETDLGSNRFGK